SFYALAGRDPEPNTTIRKEEATWSRTSSCRCGSEQFIQKENFPEFTYRLFVLWNRVIYTKLLTHPKITKVMEKEDKISDTILKSYLIMLTKDRELDNQFRKTIIETTIPKTYHKGVIIHGDALKKHLSNLKNIFPRLLDTQFHFSTITDEDYVNWLKVFYQWWEDQQEWLL